MEDDLFNLVLQVQLRSRLVDYLLLIATGTP